MKKQTTIEKINKAYQDGYFAGRAEAQTEINRLHEQLEKLQDDRVKVKVELVRAVAQGFDALAHSIPKDI